MANVKSIVAAHLSQRQRQINRRTERADLLDPDRLQANIIRVGGDIKVSGRPGFNWAQEYSPSDDTSPFHVFNDKVQTREGLTVWIGDGLGGRREVLDWNNATIVNTSNYNAQKYLPVHHLDHEWPDFKPGPDVVNVYPRSLSMLRTYPGEGGALTISASPLRYIKGNALIVFPGKISLDINASQPASGLARFVGIYLDPDDNTLKTVNGVTTGDSPVIIPDGPTFPESAILSANVRLDGDMTVIGEVDIVDARQILDSSGATDGTRVSKLVSPDGSVDPVISVDNNGDIGAGVAPSSVAKFRLLDASGTQLRIEFDATKFADFEVDTSHHLTIDPSSTGQIKLNATITVIDEIQHEGDPDTKIGFIDDKFSLTVGGLLMFEAVEIAGQDTLDLGDVGGGGDVDINFSNGQAFLQGSTGRLGIGTITPGNVSGGTGVSCHVMTQGDTFPAFRMERENAAGFTDRAWAFGITDTGSYFIQDVTGAKNRLRINIDGLFSIGPGHAPEGSLHGYTDDNDVGWMWTSATGVDGTPTELKVNDTRDVVRIMSYETVGYDGGATERATGSLTPGNEAEIFNDATDIFKLRVNADGSVDVRRTAGASTLQIGLKLMWI